MSSTTDTVNKQSTQTPTQPPDYSTTNKILTIVLIALGMFAMVCFIIYFLCLLKKEKRLRTLKKESYQNSHAVSNIYSKLPVRQVRFPKFRNPRAPTRKLPPIPPPTENEVIYAQVEILNPPETSNNAHLPETERTLYAEIQLPNTAGITPTVQFSGRYEDTYGCIVRNLPPATNLRGHSHRNSALSHITQSAGK